MIDLDNLNNMEEHGTGIHTNTSTHAG